MKTILIHLLVAVVALVSAPATHGKTVLRVGHFPNITHAQAVVAHALSRRGKCWFESFLGPDVEIQWFIYNAGPSAMEAIFAKSIDLTYCGPNPALNAYIRSEGEEIRVIAGAAYGGAALVVQADGGLKSPADFKGRKIASPQFGGTQDVAARAWLAAGGLKITQRGGEAFVIPTPNADQLTVFARKEIDAVWTVEPWVTRLEKEAGGKILVEQKDTVTTFLVSGVKLLKEQAALVRKFAAAHRELTEWINANPALAQALLIAELEAETKAKFKPEVVARAWSRITFSNDISLPPIQALVKEAQSVGFLKNAGDLSKLVEIPK